MAKISEKICHSNAGIFLFTAFIIQSSYLNRKCYINGIYEVEVHETREKNEEGRDKIIIIVKVIVSIYYNYYSIY